MKTSRTNSCSSEVPKQKERHIVTWSQEEDDVLREQIRIHGTDNWAIIASRFKDKTTRQCRRRWYTYLNSDFKKGGWSAEEDMLLCEAQKIFGNRWTEIAKVVSGRTDNAVKNRFSTLCKKRAKHEAVAKENSTSFVNLNNKRVLFRDRRDEEVIETEVPVKKMRSHFPEVGENCNQKGGLIKECGITNQLIRSPLAILVQNFQSISNLPAEHHSRNTLDATCDVAVSSNVIQGTYLKKDDPKIIALTQQAELLSSLAHKVNTENTDQSLENAWKVLQDFLNQGKDSDILGYRITEMDFQLEDFKDLIEDLRSSNEGSQSSWRQPGLYEDSPQSSEYSTGSTLILHKTVDKADDNHGEGEVCMVHGDIEAELKSPNIGEPGLGECGAENPILDVLPNSDEVKIDDGAACELSNTEFSSPFQVTPLFTSLAAGIPSPQFSESERHFLLKTLGMESSSPDPRPKSSKPPPCKRILLNSL